MGSDISDGGDSRSRRRNYDDDAKRDDVSVRKRRLLEGEDVDRTKRRHRSRSGSRERKRERRDRSGSPDPKRRRSRERKRDQDGEGRQDKHRDRSRDGNREGPREKDGSSRRHRHRSSRSPERSSRRHRHRHHFTSPKPKEIDYPSSRKHEESRRASDKANPKPLVKARGPLPSQDTDFAVSNGLEPEPEVEKPNFKPTGALAAAANAVTTNTGETVTLKYHEPPEARKPPPRDKWKLFVFKGKDVVDTVELSQRSCWLVGRDRAVVDLPAEHPSISKQHAVLQFRHVEKRNEFGDRVGKVKPYLIDLESANGTVLNGDKVPESRYLEVRGGDVIKFGLSEREYVIMLDRE